MAFSNSSVLIYPASPRRLTADKSAVSSSGPNVAAKPTRRRRAPRSHLKSSFINLAFAVVYVLLVLLVSTLPV
jgi:hypothetical protein